MSDEQPSRKDTDPLLASLKRMSGVEQFARSCSVCGEVSDQGWGVGLRKDWATGVWYCLEHAPWNSK